MDDAVTYVWTVGLIVICLLLLLLCKLVAKLFHQLLELLQLNCNIQVDTMYICIYHTYTYTANILLIHQMSDECLMNV